MWPSLGCEVLALAGQSARARVCVCACPTLRIPLAASCLYSSRLTVYTHTHTLTEVGRSAGRRDSSETSQRRDRPHRGDAYAPHVG